MKKIVISLCLIGLTAQFVHTKVTNIDFNQVRQVIKPIDQKIQDLELEALNLDEKAKALEKQPNGYRAAVQLRTQAKENRQEAMRLKQELMQALGK